MNLKKLYDDARRASEERGYRYGTLGRRHADTSIEYSVPGRLDYLYVTLTDHTVVIARNEFGVSQTEDQQVKLQMDHGTYVIVGRSTRGDLTQPTETPPSGVQPHELGEHTDAAFNDPQAGEVLVFDGNHWVNVATLPVALAATIHAATTKATPVDADELGLVDSAASNVLKRLTWANVKATIKTYYDSVAATLTNKTLDSTNISTLTSKTTPVDADSAVIVDSAASNFFKRTTYTNIKAFLKTYFDTLYDLTGAAITALATKTTPLDADAVVITDSAASNAPKRVTGTNWKAYMKTYFDTLYGLLATANTWVANNAFNSTATSGSALSVTRNLTATSTDAPVVTILQDHASDDQPAQRVTQDGTGAIAEFLDAATKILAILDGGEVRINNATGVSAFIRFAINEANKGIIGIVGSAGAIITGGAVGDVVIRTDGGKILFTTDTGTTVHMRISGGVVEVPFQLWVSHNGDLRSGFIADNTGGGRGLFRLGAADGFASFWDFTNLVGILSIAYNGGAAAIQIDTGGKVLLGLTSGNATKLGIQAGSSTNDFAVGGVLYVDSAQHGNATASVETDLSSYSVPANTLSANNMSLEFHCWGTNIGANAKTIKLYFGASVWTITSVGTAVAWSVRGRIVRTGAATQKVVFDSSIAATVPVVSTAAETLSGAVVLKMTGTCSVASQILQEGMIISWQDSNT